MSNDTIPALASECVPLLGAADQDYMDTDEFVLDSLMPCISQPDRAIGKSLFFPMVYF